MNLRWLLADVVTGNVIDELPLTLQSTLERTVSAKMTAAATLPTRSRYTPDGWPGMLAAGRSNDDIACSRIDVSRASDPGYIT